MFEYFHSGQCKRWKAYIETDHPKFQISLVNSVLENLKIFISIMKSWKEWETLDCYSVCVWSFRRSRRVEIRYYRIGTFKMFKTCEVLPLSKNLKRNSKIKNLWKRSRNFLLIDLQRIKTKTERTVTEITWQKWTFNGLFHKYDSGIMKATGKGKLWLGYV